MMTENKKAPMLAHEGLEDNTTYGVNRNMSNTKFTINVHNNENTTENAVPSAYNCGRVVKSDNIIYTGSDLNVLRKSTVYRSKEYRLIEKFIKEVKEENYIREGETLSGSVLVRDNDEIYVAILISCGYEMRGVMRHVSRHKGNSYDKNAKTVTGTVFTNWILPVGSEKGLMFPITFFDNALNNVPTSKVIEAPAVEEKATVNASVNEDVMVMIKAMQEEIASLKARVEVLEAENAELKAANVETPVVAAAAPEVAKVEAVEETVSSVEITADVFEKLMNKPTADFWNTIVCRKITGAPVTQFEINSGKINIMRDLVLKSSNVQILKAA